MASDLALFPCARFRHDFAFYANTEAKHELPQ